MEKKTKICGYSHISSFSPWDFLPERSCRGVSRLIDVDNNAQYAINSAGLAIARGNVPRFRFHPITFVCSHPPFPRQGLTSRAASRWLRASNLRSAARARSAITTKSSRYFAISLSKASIRLGDPRCASVLVGINFGSAFVLSFSVNRKRYHPKRDWN